MRVARTSLGALLVVVVLALDALPAVGAAHSEASPTTAHSSIRAAAATPALPALPTIPPWGTSAPARPALAALDSAETVIFPNGTISNLSAPIHVAGNWYNLTSSFAGGILDERNGSILNGAGFTLHAAGNLSEAVDLSEVADASVVNLTVVSGRSGIDLFNSLSARILNDRVQAVSWGVLDSSGVRLNVSSNNFYNATGVLLDNTVGAVVDGNNVSHTLSWGVVAEYASNVLVAGNDAHGSSDGIAAVYGGNVSVRGNLLAGDSIGIYLDNVANASATGNALGGAAYGIEVFDCEGVTLTNDIGAHDTIGVLVDRSTSLRLDHLRMTGAITAGLSLGSDFGVVLANSNFSGGSGNDTALYGVSEATVSNLTLVGHSAAGLLLNSSKIVTVEDIDASAGSMVSGPAFAFYGDTRVVARDFWANGTQADVVAGFDNGLDVSASAFVGTTGTAIDVSSSTNVTATGITLSKLGGSGVFSDNGNGLRLDHLTIQGALGDGIYTANEYAPTITDNLIANVTDVAILVVSGSAATIDGNWIENGNSTYAIGLLVESVVNLYVANNTVVRVNISFYDDYCGELTAVGNNFSNSYVGLSLFFTRSSTFVGNWIANDRYGFNLESTSAVFGHNDFVNDSGWLNYVPYTSTVAWDLGYPAGGNYWSNHTGPDTLSGPSQSSPGRDGIVDTPFTINATMADRYPLARPWTSPTVTVHETGLPVGTSWTARIGNATIVGNGSALVAPVESAANGTIPYVVTAVPGYRAGQALAGSVAYTGKKLSVNLTFAPVLFSVVFAASGLHNGTGWSVEVASQNLSSKGATINWTAANGSYPYTVANVAGYALTTPSGTASVRGGAVRIAVTYVWIPVINNTGPTNGSHGNGTNGTGGHTPPGGGGTPGGGSPGTTSAGPKPASGYGVDVVEGLVGAIAVLAALAGVGFLLYFRSRRRGATPPPQPWAPPAAAPAVVAGASAARPPLPVPTAPAPPPGASGGATPDWSEDQP